VEWGGEDGCNLFRVKTRDQALFDVESLPGAAVSAADAPSCVGGFGLRVQEGDAGPHHNLGLGQVEGQLADVLDAKRRRQRAIVEREADFLVGFAAGDLERRLG
jgi:hypothetical protein